MKFKHRVIMTVSMLLAMVILFLVEIRLAAITGSGEDKQEKTEQKVADEENVVKGPPAKERPPSNQNVPNIPYDPRFGLDMHHRRGEERLNRLLKRMNRTGVQGPPLPRDLILENLSKQKPFLTEDRNDRNSHLRNKSMIAEIPELNRDVINRALKFKDDGLAKKLSETLNQLEDASDELGNVDHVRKTAAPIKARPEVAWEIWHKWVKPEYLYPEEAFWSDEMNQILNAMATAPITSFGVGHKGTQLKAMMMLGKQKTAFKPMR